MERKWNTENYLRSAFIFVKYFLAAIFVLSRSDF